MMSDVYDAIPARDITPPEGGDVLSLLPGEECKASIGNKLYPARVIAIGEYTDIKKQQQEREKEAERNDVELENDDEYTASLENKNAEKVVEKEEMSKGTGEGDEEGDNGKSSKAAEKNYRNIQNKGKKGQRKNNGNTPSRNPGGDPEDGHHKESSVPVKQSSQNKGKKATKDSHQCKERSSGESHKEHQHSQESTAKGTGEGGLKEKKDRPKALASPRPHLTPSTKPKAVNRKVAAKRSPCNNLLTSYISDSSSEQSEEELSSPAKRKKKQPSVQDRSGSEDEPQTTHDSFEARRIKNIAENEMFKKMIGLGPAMLPTTITSEVTKLKEKVRVLEKSHISLKRKLSEQEAEIDHLRRINSSEVSSSAEATPESSFSFLPPQGPFSARRSPVYNSPAYSSPASREPSKHEDTPPFLKGVDAVRLANAKLQPDTGTAALKLMDCVFSTSEMVNGNPSGVTRSKDQIRQRTIRPLDAQKMRYIDAILHDKWGLTTADKTTRRKMTQICTDFFPDQRYKHLRLM